MATTPDSQKPITTIRFPPSMVAMARRLAERDDKTLSAWVRHIVEREVARREGICPTCGHREERKET